LPTIRADVQMEIEARVSVRKVILGTGVVPKKRVVPSKRGGVFPLEET
jgi:hypothetical protein